MVQFSKKIEIAVANCSGAIEFRDHRLQSIVKLKNGRSLKSQMRMCNINHIGRILV